MASFGKLKAILPRGLRRRLGAVRRRLRARSSRTRSQKERLLESPALDAAERELLRQVESGISSDDGMYKGDGEHYFKVGLSAIRCIEEATARARLENIERVLDMPCGYGRVLRFLSRRFPQARMTACEIDREAVRFCVEKFGASPAYSSYDLNEVALDSQFDLIWCGSLITHLDATRTLDLLRFFRRQLSEGGLLLFTTHGDFVAGRVLDMADFYGLDRASIPSLTAAYSQSGHGYLDYPEQEGYGVSLTSPAWIRAQVREVGGLDEVYFKARGWDEHQDVYGFVRRAAEASPK